MITWQRLRTPSRHALRGLMLAIGIVTSFACAQTVSSGSSTTTVHQSGGASGSRSEVAKDAGGHRVVTTDGSSTDVTIQRQWGGDAAARRPAEVERTPPPVDSGRFESGRFDDGEHATPWRDSAGPTREAFRQQMEQRMQRSPTW